MNTKVAFNTATLNLDIQLNQTKPKGRRSYDSHFPPYIAEVQFASVLVFYVQIICPSLRNLKKKSKEFHYFSREKIEIKLLCYSTKFMSSNTCYGWQYVQDKII